MKLNELGDALNMLDQHVNFAALADAAPTPSRQRGGRSPSHIELMVRVLLIEQLST